MFPTILTLATSLVGALQRQRQQVAQAAAVEPKVIDRVLKVLPKLLQHDPQFQQDAQTAIEQARQHHIKTLVQNNVIVETARGLVRPVITLLAVLFYLAARLFGIELTTEDYAIIGGVIAFWFGVRPFEKAR